jgi:uncharacterized membrane protein YfcA
MGVVELVGIALAGMGAGAINAVVGSGTLISFPVLLTVGYPPIVANVSNSIGLVPGSISGAYAYREQLDGTLVYRGRQVSGWRLLRRLLPLSFLGAVAGAVLLFVLPARAFATIVPVLIALALVLVVIQPRLSKRLAEREGERTGGRGILVRIGLFFCGVYGGYFGAAQGVLTVGLMANLMDAPLQRINGLKNVMVAVVNLVAGVVFVFIGHIAWPAVLLLAVGSVIGGLIGARFGKRLPEPALRTIIVVVGLAAIVKLVAFP